MKRMLSPVAKAHRTGSHCGSTMLRTILNAHGYQVSEELCFGLGSGLGFTYYQYPGESCYFFTGRNESLQENLAGVLGLRIEFGRPDNAVTAWQEVKAFLDSGIPVILDLDRMHVPYLLERSRLGAPVHIGLHNAILVGYDDERGCAYLLDYMWNDVQEIPFSDLAAARSSQAASVKPENAWKALIPPVERRNLRVAVTEALYRNVARMRHPYVFMMGLNGLKHFAREVRRWSTAQSEAERQLNASMAATSFERIGTGGGNFRRLFGRFLVEAGQILDRPAVSAVSSRYMELVQRWRSITKLFDQAAADPNAGIFAANPAVDAELAELVRLEHEAIAALEAALA